MAKQDASKPEFWEKRFRENFTPWDAGGVPRDLEQFLKAEPRGRRVLIPGCGSGYEVRAFANAGHDVLAGFRAFGGRACAEGSGPSRTVSGSRDFFEDDRRALRPGLRERSRASPPRPLRPRCAAHRRAAFAARPDRRILLFEDGERGPPFGLRSGELEALFTGRFERVTDAAVSDSIPIFEGKERWQVWSAMRS